MSARVADSVSGCGPVSGSVGRGRGAVAARWRVTADGSAADGLRVPARRRTQAAGEVGRARVSILGFPRQRAQQDGAHGLGDRAVERARIPHASVEDRADVRAGRAPLVRELAGQQLVQDDGEAVEIRAQVGRRAAQDLGRHVRIRPEHVAPRRLDAGGERARQSEVDDLEVSVAVDHEVAGTDVAVHEIARMRVGERVGCGGDPGDGLVDRDRGLADDVAQRGPVDVRHGDEGTARRVTDVVHGGDAGMLEHAAGARLAHELAAHSLVTHEFRMRQLDRDAATEDLVLGQPHVSRAARADPVHQAEASDDDAGSGMVQGHCAVGGILSSHG